MITRYIDHYTPLIQEFVREVEPLSHPDIKRMPEPFFPAFGPGYEKSAFRLAIIGQDTRGWGDMREFLSAEKETPGIKLHETIGDFRSRDFVRWGRSRHHFWGFGMMLLAALYGREDWGVMKTGAMVEVLDSFAWGNLNALELYGSSPSRQGIPLEYWAAVRKAGARFDRFRHIAETLQPQVAVVLCRGMNPQTYFEGYAWEKLSSEGRLTHYRLTDIGVDVFHAPHPRSMGYKEGADHFCTNLKELFVRNDLVLPFPEFVNGNNEAEDVLAYLGKRAPSPNSAFDKYGFVSWVAEELAKNGTFMSVPALVQLVNAKGYKTDYQTEYSGLRGSYRLVSGTYRRLKSLGSPEGDAKAHNVAVAFRKPSFDYAYDTNGE